MCIKVTDPSWDQSLNPYFWESWVTQQKNRKCNLWKNHRISDRSQVGSVTPELPCLTSPEWPISCFEGRRGMTGFILRKWRILFSRSDGFYFQEVTDFIFRKWRIFFSGSDGFFFQEVTDFIFRKWRILFSGSDGFYFQEVTDLILGNDSFSLFFSLWNMLHFFGQFGVI